MLEAALFTIWVVALGALLLFFHKRLKSFEAMFSDMTRHVTDLETRTDKHAFKVHDLGARLDWLERRK